MDLREKLAEWFEQNLTYDNFHDWTNEEFADALLPVVEGAQAEAWKRCVAYFAGHVDTDVRKSAIDGARMSNPWAANVRAGGGT